MLKETDRLVQGLNCLIVDCIKYINCDEVQVYAVHLCTAGLYRYCIVMYCIITRLISRAFIRL